MGGGDLKVIGALGVGWISEGEDYECRVSGAVGDSIERLAADVADRAMPARKWRDALSTLIDVLDVLATSVRAQERAHLDRVRRSSPGGES